MKPWIAFLGGAVLAAGIAAIAIRKDNSAVQQAVVTSPPQAPAAATTAAAPAVAPIPEPEQPTPALNPTPAAVPITSPAKSKKVVRSIPPAEAPPAVPVPAAVENAPTPQQPVTQPAPAQPPAPSAPPAPTEPNRVTIIAGTAISIRLMESLSSDVVQVGQSFEGTLDQPLIVDGFVIAERGARVDGRIVDSQKAGRVKGVSHLAIELTRFTTADGQRISISTVTWEKEGEETRGSDARKVAVGTGIGAALGAIFGGGKGAAIGAGTGAGAGTGVVLATRGKPVVLPIEQRITFRLKAPVTVTEKR